MSNEDSQGGPQALLGRTAWVTGASRGLGRAIALGLADAGARVALTSRSVDGLTVVRDEIVERGGEAIIAPAQVEEPELVDDVARSIVDNWGRLDVLVNNAGISPNLSRSRHVSDVDWKSVLDVNLSGTFYCSRAAGRAMANSGGSIVNITSVHGSVGMGRLAAYSASKGGVEALTRTLALEWADQGIRVNAVAPGYFETDMTTAMRSSERWNARLLAAIPLKRFGRPTEILPAVLFLASDASSYVTGTTLSLDGGWTAQ